MSELHAKEAKQKLEKSQNEQPATLMDDQDREHKMFALEANRALLQRRLNQSTALMHLRTRWSTWLLVCVVGIVFLNFTVVFLLGFDLMHFPHPSIFPIFIGQSLLQILGMGYVVVQFLFHKDSFGLQD